MDTVLRYYFLPCLLACVRTHARQTHTHLQVTQTLVIHEEDYQKNYYSFYHHHQIMVWYKDAGPLSCVLDCRTVNCMAFNWSTSSFKHEGLSWSCWDVNLFTNEQSWSNPILSTYHGKSQICVASVQIERCLYNLWHGSSGGLIYIPFMSVTDSLVVPLMLLVPLARQLRSGIPWYTELGIHWSSILIICPYQESRQNPISAHRSGCQVQLRISSFLILSCHLIWSSWLTQWESNMPVWCSSDLLQHPCFYLCMIDLA